MERKMIKATIIALCATATVMAMESNERNEFMRNGRNHARGMSPDQRRAFMRDGHEHARRSRSGSESFSESEDMEELLNLARKLSLKEKKKANKEKNKPTLETVSEGSTVYKVKINQNLSNSTGSVNIGSNTSFQ